MTVRGSCVGAVCDAAEFGAVCEAAEFDDCQRRLYLVLCATQLSLMTV
jgi:hypothetical protein